MIRNVRFKPLLNILLLSALLIAANPVSALATELPDSHKTWTGIQVPGMPFPDYSMDIKYCGVAMVVEISGLRMDTVSGYDFDGIHVAYERMDNVTIVFNPEGLPYPISPPLSIMYLYPHNGKITWYDAEGNVVGAGTFGSRGSNVGSLVVNGLGLHVEGEYGLWVDYDNPYLVGHTGWYITYP